MMKNENTPAPPAESSRALEEAQEGCSLTDERIEQLAKEAGFGFFGQWMLWQGDTKNLIRLARAVEAQKGRVAAPADHLPAANGAKGEIVERDGFGPKTPLRWPPKGADLPPAAITAFERIMGDPTMPPDDAPGYDRWLFIKAWDAGVAAALGMEVIDPAADAAVLDTQREEGK